MEGGNFCCVAIYATSHVGLRTSVKTQKSPSPSLVDTFRAFCGYFPFLLIKLSLIHRGTMKAPIIRYG
jgi:hypothetical protein